MTSLPFLSFDIFFAYCNLFTSLRINRGFLYNNISILILHYYLLFLSFLSKFIYNNFLNYFPPCVISDFFSNYLFSSLRIKNFFCHRPIRIMLFFYNFYFPISIRDFFFNNIISIFILISFFFLIFL